MSPMLSAFVFGISTLGVLRTKNKWLRSAVCGCCLEILWPQWALAQVDLAGLAAARA